MVEAAAACCAFGLTVPLSYAIERLRAKGTTPRRAFIAVLLFAAFYAAVVIVLVRLVAPFKAALDWLVDIL